LQKFIVEVDSIKLLKQYLDLALVTTLDSYAEIAVKVVDRKDKYISLSLPPVIMDQDKHFPVILIGGWHLPDSGKENSYFAGRKPWTVFRSREKMDTVSATIHHIEKLFQRHGKAGETQFTQKFGEGYNDCFNRSDGHTGPDTSFALVVVSLKN
jgi:hypothetical protein